jgi:hypothetical protein
MNKITCKKFLSFASLDVNSSFAVTKMFGGEERTAKSWDSLMISKRVYDKTPLNVQTAIDLDYKRTSTTDNKKSEKVNKK